MYERSEGSHLPRASQAFAHNGSVTVKSFGRAFTQSKNGRHVSATSKCRVLRTPSISRVCCLLKVDVFSPVRIEEPLMIEVDKAPNQLREGRIGLCLVFAPSTAEMFRELMCA